MKMMRVLLMVLLLVGLSASSPIVEADVVNDDLEGLIQALLTGLQNDMLPQGELLQLIDDKLEEQNLDPDADLPVQSMLDLLSKAMQATEFNAGSIGVGYSEDELALMDRISYLAQQLENRASTEQQQEPDVPLTETNLAVDESSSLDETDELAILLGEIGEEEASGDGGVGVELLEELQELLNTEENNGEAENITSSQLQQLEQEMNANTQSGESYEVAEIEAEVEQIEENQDITEDEESLLDSILQAVEEEVQNQDTPNVQVLDELEAELQQVDMGLVPAPEEETLQELGLAVEMENATYRDLEEPEPAVLDEVSALIGDIESELQMPAGDAEVALAASDEDAIAAIADEAQEYTLGGENLSSEELEAIDDELQMLIGQDGATSAEAPSISDLQALEDVVEFEKMEEVAEGLQDEEAENIDELTEIDDLADGYQQMLLNEEVQALPPVADDSSSI